MPVKRANPITPLYRSIPSPVTSKTPCINPKLNHIPCKTPVMPWNFSTSSPQSHLLKGDTHSKRSNTSTNNIPPLHARQCGGTLLRRRRSPSLTRQIVQRNRQVSTTQFRLIAFARQRATRIVQLRREGGKLIAAPAPCIFVSSWQGEGVGCGDLSYSCAYSRPAYW